MKDIAADIYSFNGILYNIKNEDLSSNQDSALKIYEVIRVIDGKPLFLEDHFQRLVQSTLYKNVKLTFGKYFLRDQIMALAEKNNLQNFNCMITCYFKDNQCQSLFYVRKHFYPPSSFYLNGVALDLIQIKRKDPNVKAIDENYNKLTQEAKSKPSIFEVLLVDDDNLITEASKANVFFIKGDTIITAPIRKVLAGVTRRYVIEAIKEAGVKLVEESLRVEMLQDMDGAFLTGTSLGMLPVSVISGVPYNTPLNFVFNRVNKVFLEIIENYLRGNDHGAD